MHKSCAGVRARGRRREAAHAARAVMCNKQAPSTTPHYTVASPSRRTSPTHHSNAAMSQYVDYITVYVGGLIRLMF